MGVTAHWRAIPKEFRRESKGKLKIAREGLKAEPEGRLRCVQWYELLKMNQTLRKEGLGPV